jgi:BASS family bile acid:Na+ symporter
MLVVEIIPLWLVNLLSFLTVFSVMMSIGVAITLSACFQHIRSPSLLARGLASVLVIVPMVGIAASFLFGLDLAEKVGVALIVMAPGAPLALRRALGSGADVGFATTLQVVASLLAVVVLPLWVIISNVVLGTHGTADAVSVTKQVFLAGSVNEKSGARARSEDRHHARTCWRCPVDRGGSKYHGGRALFHPRDAPPADRCCGSCHDAALFIGHLVGGPRPELRHSIAIVGAMRNVGLALLVATINRTPPDVAVIILSYGITAILIVTAYILWWSKVLQESRYP